MIKRGSQIWPYNMNCPSKFCISSIKAVRSLWKTPYRTHNKYINIIIINNFKNCMPIDITLEQDVREAYKWRRFVCTVSIDRSTTPILLKIDIHVRFAMMHV